MGQSKKKTTKVVWIGEELLYAQKQPYDAHDGQGHRSGKMWQKMLIQRFFKGCGKGMDIHPVVFSLYYIKPREKPLFVLDVL